jgi:hypothetical protein
MVAGLVSLELVSTVASVGTFLVIAATAIAAVVQLSHLRASNQLTGLLSVVGRSEDPQLIEWSNSIKAHIDRLSDPAYRAALDDNTFDRNDAPWLHLYNWYDYVGSLAKQRLIPVGAIVDVFAFRVVHDWEIGEQLIAISRRKDGPGVWENFEYLVVESKEFIARYPSGNYPKRKRRLPLVDEWLQADTAARPR